MSEEFNKNPENTGDTPTPATEEDVLVIEETQDENRSSDADDSLGADEKTAPLKRSKKSKTPKVKKEKKPHKKMSKKAKVWMIIGCIAAALILWSTISSALAGKTPTEVKTTPLTKTTLKSTISTTGAVESTAIEQITNNTGLPVWDIKVSVGSWVEPGSVLCTLYDEKTDTWSNVTSTVSGTVTNIAAQSGAPASGILFSISNTNSLRIVTNIKEADLASVRTGMAVTIKTDATGTTEYTGVVASIAPTATTATGAAATSLTTTAGTTASTQNPEFQTIINFTSDTSGLRIGMKARCTIITEEKPDVYAVAFDALTTNAAGQKVIMAAADEQDGTYTVKEIPVTTGIESDFNIEISGEGLTDGLQVIDDPTTVKAGDLVVLSSAGGSASNAAQ